METLRSEFTAGGAGLETEIAAMPRSSSLLIFRELDEASAWTPVSAMVMAIAHGSEMVGALMWLGRIVKQNVFFVIIRKEYSPYGRRRGRSRFRMTKQARFISDCLCSLLVLELPRSFSTAIRWENGAESQGMTMFTNVGTDLMTFISYAMDRVDEAWLNFSQW